MMQRQDRQHRILFYGAGNCSFEKAYCKNDLPGGDIEVVITVYEKLDPEVLADIKAQIQEVIPEYRRKWVTISVYDKVDATNTDERIKGQFDEIIFNFPTPRGQRVDMDKVFQNIVEKGLLRKHTMDGQRVKYHPGKFKVAYWVDPYQSEYEYDYRFAKAQKKEVKVPEEVKVKVTEEDKVTEKKINFKLTERTIFNLKKWKDLGYKHTLWSGEESQRFDENKVPMLNTYEENLKPTNEDEWSDSDDLRKDALHARFFKFPNNYPNSHQNSTLLIGGQRMRRCDYQLTVYQKNPSAYSLEKIEYLIKKGDFRGAERRLKVLLEMDPAKHNVDFSSDQFRLAIEAPIEEAYKAANNISQTTRDNLFKYQANRYDWEVKLKALTGVEIPVLNSKLQYN